MNMNSPYARASCEYQTKSGPTVTSAAHAIAAERSASSRPIPHATGTSAMPAIAEGRRRANAPLPRRR